VTDSARRGAKFPLRLDQLTSVAKPVPPRTEVLRPQQPLHQAARDATRAHQPSGMGLDSADVRSRMVQRLRAHGIRHDKVLDALARVPRHTFVDAALVTQAYEDTSLPIGHGQTISKPSVVARMVELLMDGSRARTLGGLGRVLEIGTGCGYQAAVLCLLARHVVSIERIKPLHDKAALRVASLRMDRLRLVHGDGMLGHAPNAPYDSIIAAACGDEVPEAWLAQLAVGGRLIAPVGSGAVAGSRGQSLLVLDRNETGFDRSVYEAVQFVPLKSGVV
jgi:protein-L-isoaspartate(D-aspartate) O-methyltransferase